MEVRLFRRIGFIYAVVCFIGSAAGVIIFFKQLVDGGRECSEFYCEGNISGSESMLLATIQMVLCLISAVIYALLKVGIDEAKMKYIRIHKAFMATRNFVLIVRWTFVSVTLGIIQIGGVNPPAFAEQQNFATVMLLFISVLFGVEMWITDGIQRYVEEVYIYEENVDIL
ncbi:uncharacterized protein LOC131694163 [Topomyia yanbarensis]|uniref:uncharacterized protein LOC131694163 n=1 Tax=Topomyia yanbarensis TaxID=2498891 RepID=UPI00273B4FAE|nr:uncharacterized protein LOC131694163 [Topomyia yanbarensis]